MRRGVLIGAVVAVVVAAFGWATWSFVKRGPALARSASALEQAVMFVRGEAEGATGLSDLANPRFRLYVALSAMSYVQTNLSSARYSLEKRRQQAGFRAPDSTEACLEQGIGICGNHVRAFLDIMDRLGIPARPIQIYYTSAAVGRQSHIVTEVEWDGRWHMFDVTWGFVALGEDGAPLSLAELRGGARYRARINQNNPWTVVAGQSLDLFEYLTAEADVVVDRKGTIRPYVTKRSADRIEYGLLHIPDIVGVYRPGKGREERIAFELDLPDGFDTVTIVPDRVQCRGGGGIWANGIAVEVGPQAITFTDLRGRVRIEAESRSGNETCYVKVKELVAGRGR